MPWANLDPDAPQRLTSKQEERLRLLDQALKETPELLTEESRRVIYSIQKKFNWRSDVAPPESLPEARQQWIGSYVHEKTDPSRGIEASPSELVGWGDTAVDIGIPAAAAVGAFPHGAAYGAPMGPAGSLIGGAAAAAAGAIGGEATNQLRKFVETRFLGVDDPLGAPRPSSNVQALGQMFEQGAMGAVTPSKGLRAFTHPATRWSGLYGPDPRSPILTRLAREKLLPQQGRPVAGVLNQNVPVRALQETEPVVAQLASEFGVPVTGSQRTQSTWKSWVTNALKKTLTGGGEFSVYERKANVDFTNAMDMLEREINRIGFTPKAVGQLTQSFIDESVSAMEVLWDTEVIKGVIKKSGNPLVVGFGAKSGPELATAAAELQKGLNSFTKLTPAAAGNQQINMASEILGAFLNPDRKLVLSLEDMVNLRRTLRELTSSGVVNIGKNNVKLMNGHIDTAIIRTLKRNGQQGLAQKFRDTSDTYRKFMTAYEHEAIQKIVNSKSPEAIVDLMVNDAVTLQSATEAYHKVIARSSNPEGAKRVFGRRLWEIISERVQQEQSISQVGRGVVTRGRLEAQLDKIPKPARELIWGKRLSNKITRLTQLAHYLSPQSGINSPISDQAANLLALGQGASVTAAVAGIATGFMLEGDASTMAFVASAGILGTVLILPPLMAKLITREAAVDVLLQAARTADRGPAAAHIGMKLATWISWASKEAKKDEFRRQLGMSSMAGLERHQLAESLKKSSLTEVSQPTLGIPPAPSRPSPQLGGLPSTSQRPQVLFR